MIYWLFPTCIAAPAAQQEDYRSYLDQAKFFLKRGWEQDAAEQLELASRHPDGALDPEVWFLLARVRYELADLPGAIAAADRALTQSRDDVQASATREWLSWLEGNFGRVRLTAGKPGLLARVELELDGVILDPELKQWYARARDRLDDPVVLPLELGLPAGYRYLLNGEPVQVTPGRTLEHPVSVRDAVLQQVEFQASVGVGAWLASEARNLYPAPSTELGVVVPVGPVVLGLRGGAGVQPFEGLGGRTRTTAFGTVGGEIGLQVPVGDAVALRSGASFRTSRIPGLRTTDMDTPAGALVPGGWVAAVFADRSRPSGLGLGMRVMAERASIRDAASSDSDGVWGFRGMVDVAWAL